MIRRAAWRGEVGEIPALDLYGAQTLAPAVFYGALVLEPSPNFLTDKRP